MKKRAQGSLFLCPIVPFESDFRSGNGKGAVHLFEEALQHFARTHFNRFGRSQFNHLVHALRPAHRGSQLSDEVLANDFWIGFRRGVYVLDHRAAGAGDWISEVLCQGRPWQMGPAKKDMSPVDLRVVIYCAPLTREGRGRGNARARRGVIFSGEPRRGKKRGTRVRRAGVERGSVDGNRPYDAGDV